MSRYLVRRLLRTVLVIIIVSTVVFLILRLSGDPVRLLLPEDATPAEVAELRRHLSLDEPLLVQYGAFWRNLVQGDWGQSLRHKRPAMGLVLERLPATAQLAAAAFVLAVIAGVLIGVISAVRRGGVLDNVLMSLALIGQSMPVFWLGIMLILVFSVQLHLLPTSGRESLANLVMPAVTLAFLPMAIIARLTRSAMLDVLRQDYIRTGWAKGLSEVQILGRHALKNAALPVVTVMGLQFGALLAGAVVTETVFAWPGIGRLAIEAIYNRDYPVVQAVVFLTALLFTSINLLVDYLYTILDPRIRLGAREGGAGG